MKAGKQNQNENDSNDSLETVDTYITIQGNIGCGKSTFIEVLRQKIPEVKWVEQPVQQWQNVSGKNINLLERYYEEPKRWGFTFQIYAIFTRIKKLNQAIQRYPNKLKISQRSILADKYVFSSLMKDLGYMNNSQYQVFKSLYKTFESMIQIKYTKAIYLRCTPEKCFQRLKNRQRHEQSQIPLEYLKQIHDKHEKWFNNFNTKDYIILDTTQNFKDDNIKIDEMIIKLRKFMIKQQ